MGFIEEMAKAKMYDQMQTKQVSDAMDAASKALQEQKVKEASMNSIFQNVVRNAQGGLANTAIPTETPMQPAVMEAPVAPTNAPVGLADMMGRS